MKAKPEVLDALKKAYGLPPYNCTSNFLIGDGYFSNWIRKTFTLEEINAGCTELHLKEWKDLK